MRDTRNLCAMKSSKVIIKHGFTDVVGISFANAKEGRCDSGGGASLYNLQGSIADHGLG